MQLTIRLAIGATILAAFLAVVVGVYSAVRQYTICDYVLTFIGFLFLSTPVFWLAGPAEAVRRHRSERLLRAKTRVHPG